ncbi:restriction endonuclease subunit S, partial [Arthrospira platensis SPKY1]|nr:restriction endonuclease subunit S [Arthrospira platensis SPKY1]
FAFKSKQFVDSGNPVVKIKNIVGDGTVKLQNCQCVSDEDSNKVDHYQLVDGDLLIAMTGATVGKVGMIHTGGNKVYLNQRVAKFESERFGHKVSFYLYCLFRRSEIFDAV